MYVRQGGIVGTESFLIQPPGNAYSGLNISIHGIDPSMTRDSPTFAELWPTLEDGIGGRPVVAHNASFDLSVLRHELDHLGLSYPDLEYDCTLVLSRACRPGLHGHRLPDLSLDELVRKLMGDEHADVLRESLVWFVSELMEAEVTQQIGEACVNGVSTRKVDRLVTQLGVFFVAFRLPAHRLRDRPSVGVDDRVRQPARGSCVGAILKWPSVHALNALFERYGGKKQ